MDLMFFVYILIGSDGIHMVLDRSRKMTPGQPILASSPNPSHSIIPQTILLQQPQAQKPCDHAPSSQHLHVLGLQKSSETSDQCRDAPQAARRFADVVREGLTGCEDFKLGFRPQVLRPRFKKG
jgi:hypothetical protein